MVLGTDEGSRGRTVDGTRGDGVGPEGPKRRRRMTKKNLLVLPKDESRTDWRCFVLGPTEGFIVVRNLFSFD